MFEGKNPKNIIEDFKADLEKLEKKKEEKEEKEPTPEQIAEKKQKEKEMFEHLAKEALFRDQSHLNIDLRQIVPSYIKEAIKWLKLGGSSFKDAKEWINDKIKESAKEAKEEKDQKRINFCKELKGALRSFKEEK